MPGWRAEPGCSRSRRSRPTRSSTSSSCNGRPCEPRRPGSRSRRPAASPSSTASPARRSGARAPLLRECCNALLASFKIWNAATVGGNICMSLPAGPMISLTVALEATYTLWPRDALAARGPGRRLRHRQPRQRPAARRAAAQHPPAGGGAVEAVRVPPRLAHPSRAVGGAADRHAGRGRRSPAHDHRGDAAADPAAVRACAVGDRAAASDRRAHPGRRLFRRRPRLGRLQAPPHLSISPSRSAPSWRSPERADELYCHHARRPTGADRRPHDYTVNGKAFSAEPRPGPVPAHLPARARRLRRQERLRRGRLRRLHGLARRHARAFLPDAGVSRRRAGGHDHRRARRKDGVSCIRCSRPSSTRRRSSAASARPA